MNHVRILSLLLVVCGSLFAAAAKNAPVSSPEIGADGSTTVFRIKAPKAASVALQAQWNAKPIPMAKDENGLWSVSANEIPAGVWEYSFIVDGLKMIDPSNPAFKPQRSPSASILHVRGTPPNPWDFQEVPHGTVHQHDFSGRAAGRQRSVWVYTPPGYELSGTKRFPLLVLQHGSGDSHRTWVEHGKAHWILDNLIASGKAVPMIVMMIDGHPLGATGRDDASRAAALNAFRKELLEEALPLVEKLYRVSPEREQRAITGLSMGGWHSLSVGMNALDRFAWIGCFSGAVDEKEIAKALADPAGTNARLKLLWIACGKDDFLLERNKQLTANLAAKGIKHDWRLTAGGHSWPVWRGYLADFLPLLFR